jgi:Domain of unknown function (DUF4743)
MTPYSRHILACNTWEPARFVPFVVDNRRIGWLRRDRLALVAKFNDVFEADDKSVRFIDRLADFDSRSRGIRKVGEALLAERQLPSFREELFAAVVEWGQQPCFELDRGLLPFFGIKGFGVHLNGYFHDANGLGLWVGHRSATKKVDPLKLDNVVAGGIASGHGVFDTLIKEGAEEAAMSPSLLQAAIPAGEIRYRLEIPEGMRDDVLFIYDLEVPDDFTPENADGEFDSFERMTAARCLELVATTDLFKFNVNLTIIDFALRHGLIAGDEAERAILADALRGGLIREA